MNTSFTPAVKTESIDYTNDSKIVNITTLPTIDASVLLSEFTSLISAGNTNNAIYQMSQSSTQDTEQILDILNTLKSLVENGAKLRKLSKEVHFNINVNRSDTLIVHTGHIIVNDDGDSVVLLKHNNNGLPLEDIINCDFLVVSTENHPYERNEMKIIEDVSISVGTANPTRADKIMFWSGGTYYLKDGASIRWCRNITRTTAMRMN